MVFCEHGTSLRVLQKSRNLLISRVTVSFSVRILLHGVSADLIVAVKRAN
jgi:hypothetical protein